MLNTYVKNRGMTQTIIHNNNKNHFNQVNWDADYDGDVANISVDSNTDGKRKQFNISLDNQDLANLLNVPSVDIPIDKRLKMDFNDNFQPQIEQEYFVELPTSQLPVRKSKINESELLLDKEIDQVISSLLPNQELIIPLSINKNTKNKYTYTPKRRHKRDKTHITYKVYKKPKSITRSKTKTSSASKRKTSPVSKRKTIRFSDLL